MEKFTVRAPTRADLAGGTLDIWPVNCLFSGTRTINVALDLYQKAHFDVEESTKFQMKIQAAQAETPVFKRPMSAEEISRLPPQLKFPAAVVSAYLAKKTVLPKKSLQLRLESDVPSGSGLGGSSALCVAIARGMARIFGDYGEVGWQWNLLRWVRDVEAEFLRLPTGNQDYLAAIFGGLRSYEFALGNIQEREYSIDMLSEFSKRCLILNSGESHHSGLSNWEVYKALFEGDTGLEQGFRNLKGLADFLHEQLSQDQPDWAQIGRCLSEDWEIRREAFRVNTPRLDGIVKFLDTQPLLGRKVCGAAQGGSLLVLADPSELEGIRARCLAEKIQILGTVAVKQGVHIQVES